MMEYCGYHRCVDGCWAEFSAMVLFMSKFICYFAVAVVLGFLIAMIVDKIIRLTKS